MPALGSGEAGACVTVNCALLHSDTDRHRSPGRGVLCHCEPLCYCLPVTGTDNLDTFPGHDGSDNNSNGKGSTQTLLRLTVQSHSCSLLLPAALMGLSFRCDELSPAPENSLRAVPCCSHPLSAR